MAAGRSWADETRWRPGAGDWFAASNWTNGVPTSADIAIIDGEQDEAIIGGGSAQALRLVLGRMNADGEDPHVTQTGGSFEVGQLEVNAVGRYEMRGGAFSAAEVRLSVFPGEVGTFEWLGGTVNVGTFDFNLGRLDVGFDFDMAELASGALLGGATVEAGSGMQMDWVGVVNGAAATHASGDLSAWIVSVDGKYSLSNSGLLVDRYVAVGERGTGAFTQNGGTLRTLNTVVGDLYVAVHEGSSGSYDFIDGEIRLAHDLIVGGRGAGEFRHRAGKVSAGSVRLGAQPGGHGTYIMESGEVAAAYLRVGALAGTGRFVQTGGTVKLGSGEPFNMGSTASLDGGVGAVYELVDGSLLVTEGTPEIGFAGAALFRQSGGLVRAPHSIMVGSRDTTNRTRYEMSGGRLEAGHVYLGEYGTVRPVSAVFQQSGGDVVVATPAGSIDPGAIVMANGEWQQSGGTVTTGTLDVSFRDNSVATWTIGGGSLTAEQIRLSAREGSEDSRGTLVVGGSSVVNVGVLQVGEAGGGAIGRGTLDVASGTAVVNVSDSLRFGRRAALRAAPGATVRISGTAVKNEGINASAMDGLGNVTFVFEGGAGKLATIEAAGLDAGGGAEGFKSNFALGALRVGGVQAARVRLVDENDNHPDAAGAEAFYADEVVVGDGSRLELNGIKLYTRTLGVADRGAVDVGEGKLVVRSTPGNRAATAAQLEAWVRRGRSTQSDSEGIFTTASDPKGIMGLAVVPGADAEMDSVVTYTYHGDANGDGRINADDYFRIDQGFLAQPSGPLYAEGDLNYDETINADDYFLIDRAFLGQGAAPGAAAVAVPEPTDSFAAVASAGLLVRRRVRKSGRANWF